MAIGKKDLVAGIAEAAGITGAQAGAALESVVNQISAGLERGEQISLVGFGSFSTSERSARQGRNPQTGETMEIAASTSAKFKAGSALKAQLNK